MTGIAWSVMTKSMVGMDSISSMALVPEPTATTLCPRSSSIAATLANTRLSSSTASTQSCRWLHTPPLSSTGGRSPACSDLVVMGNHSSTVVPRPTTLWTRSLPPDCPVRPSTIERPSPVPLPIPLVVKKGSVARAMVASSIP